MKNRILAILLVVIFALSAAACGKPAAPAQTPTQAPAETPAETPVEAPAEEITLTWVGAGWAPNDKANKIIAKWNEIHPEIKVNYIDQGNTVDAAYLTNFDTMVGGGEVVDVTYLTYGDVYNRVLNGGALALDEYIAAAGDDYEAMYGTLSTAMLSYDGAIYGVPYAGNTFKVFYNKTMTDAAGITIPETWSMDEFTEVAKQLNDPDNSVYGCIFPSTWESINYLAAEVSGWSMVRTAADGTLEPNFDDEVFMSAMQWAYDLAAVEGVSPDMATIMSESIARRQVLATQGCAMIIDGPYTLVWLQNYMFNDPGEGALPFELAVTNAPYATEAGKEVSYNTIAGAFYVPKTSAHPAEAYEFEKFVCNECCAEAANYMPIYTSADMAEATKSFTEYTDAAGVQHTDVYPLDVAVAAVSTPFESHIGHFNYDPANASAISVLTTLFNEQYSLFMEGEMELAEWVEMMQEMGAAELANLN